MICSKHGDSGDSASCGFCAAEFALKMVGDLRIELAAKTRQHDEIEVELDHCSKLIRRVRTDLGATLDNHDHVLDICKAARTRIDNLESALTELIECKDLHDRIERLQLAIVAIRPTDEPQPLAELQAEYARRKPLAWENARRLMQKTKGDKS